MNRSRPVRSLVEVEPLLEAYAAPEEGDLDAWLDSKASVRHQFLRQSSASVESRCVGITYRCPAVHSMEVEDRSRR